ncbi:MAG: VOC family protein [Anaerolineales bacterium]|nr:VOC family protein [Anaerolineales bacterium]
MLVTAIDHIYLTAPSGSEDKIREFYGEVLGLNEIPKPPQLADRDGLWFDCGNLQLHIGTEAAPGNAYSSRHIAFRVSDLDAVRATLTDNGYAIEEDSAPLEGRRHFYCRDPLGNRIEFVETIEEKRLKTGDWMTKPELLQEYEIADGDIERVAVSTDGRWLAVGTSVEDDSGETASIRIWRFGQADSPEVEIEMAASVWEMAFSPNGREFAALSADGSLETWRIGDFESEQFTELPEGSEGLAYSHDGGLLAVGAGDRVKVFRPGLDELQTIRPGLGTIHALAFDAQNTLAVSGEAARIQLWQVRPVQLSSWEVLGHEAPAAQLCFNPVQPLLAALTRDGDVLLWDINTGPEDPQLVSDMGDANALAFSPEGSLLAYGGDDARVTLWDWSAQQAVAHIEAHAAVLTLTFSPDGAHLIAGCDDGRVRVWKVR